MICRECDNIMEECNGTFYFNPPPNIPGGTMIVNNATWLRCVCCKEELLPAALGEKLDELAERAKSVSLDMVNFYSISSYELVDLICDLPSIEIDSKDRQRLIRFRSVALYAHDKYVKYLVDRGINLCSA